MIDYAETIVRNLIYYKIDSSDSHLPTNNEYDYKTDEEADIIKKIFLKPFSSSTTTFEFTHDIDIALNVLNNLVNSIQNNNGFRDDALNIYKHLKGVSKHPNIKNGDLFLIKYDDIKFNNKYYEAVGIYKVENRENFIETLDNNSSGELIFKKGISGRKLDKACLVIFTEDNYTVLIIDNSDTETEYWKNEFIRVKLRNDNINNTNQLLTVTKNYITKQLSNEFEVSKADKIDLLNRSIKYFKAKENFDLDEFSDEVIGNPKGISSFLNYKKGFEEEFETIIPDNFDISDIAVKKQARVYKSVLKLDKNFHIYIHGDKELIEKGFDEGKNMNYYKVYFKEEQ